MKITYEIKLANMSARQHIRNCIDRGWSSRKHCLGYKIVRSDGKELASNLGTFTDFFDRASLWIETKKEALEILSNLARTHTHHGIFQADDTIEGTPHHRLNKGNLIC